MAEESINLLITQAKSESSGYSPGTTSLRKSSFPGIGSGIHPENHRTSTDSCHDLHRPRRNSTGKPNPSSSNEKIVSRYLRASIGSCHDFCKYGRKQAFKEKDIRPWRKRIIKDQSNEQDFSVTVPLGERKKTTVLKQIASSDMTPNPATTAALSERKKAMVLKQMTSPGTIQNPAVTASLNERKKAMVRKQVTSSAMTQNPAVIAPLDQRKKAIVLKQMASPDRTENPAMNEPLVERKKPTVLKQMMSPDRKSALKHKDSISASRSEDYQEIIKQEILLPLKKVEASSKDPSSNKKTKVEKRMNKISSKRFHSLQPSLLKQLSSFHSLASAKKAEKAEITTERVSQTRSPSVVQREAIPKASSSFATSEGSNGRGNRRDHIMKSTKMVVTKASAKKVATRPTASLAPSITRNITLKGKKSKSLKLVSSRMDQDNKQKAEMGRPENENVPVKTFHVVVTETENTISESAADNEVIPSLAPPQSIPSPKSSSQCQSPSLSSEEEGEREGEEEEEEGEIEDYDSVDEVEVEEDENEYACEEMDEILSDKDGLANNDIKVVEGNHRKTLRKGGVFSESQDPMPVKMKFRRGRVVDLQSENNVPRRLRFRRARVMDDNQGCGGEIRRRNFKKKVADDDKNGSKPSNEKVVLRHQDVQGKKDAQGLFNNVIEETASKLVESRKSKVKALVGAFETVISLQDIKPSSQTVD